MQAAVQYSVLDDFEEDCEGEREMLAKAKLLIMIIFVVFDD